MGGFHAFANQFLIHSYKNKLKIWFKFSRNECFWCTNVDYFNKKVIWRNENNFPSKNEALLGEKRYLDPMKRVTGIGGVFFKCKDAAATKAWYEKHLGIPAGQYGHTFSWQDGQASGQSGSTSWSTFPESSKYFEPEDQAFMINYRVHDLVALLAALREEGVEVAVELQEYDYGKFASIVDCDGRRVELWEPIDKPLIDFQG